MASNIGGLAATVSADVGPFNQGLNSAAQAAQRFSGRLSSTSADIASFARSASVAGAAYLAVSELISRSDEWTTFSNKIRVVTQEFGTFQVTQKAVFDLAQNIRAPIEDVGASYSRMQNSVKNLGVSQADTLKVTEGLLKSFMAFGQSGAEAASTVQQLGQALGAGKLNGDELKSVMENSVPVAEAIAKHFGVTTGELKKMGEQGKLTSKEVFKGLLEGSDGFIESFKNVEPTFKQGFDVLSNSATRAIGEFTKMTGASEGFGSALAGLGGYIDGFSQSVTSGQFGQLAGVIGTQWKTLLGNELNEFSMFIGSVGDQIAANFSRGWYQVLPNLKAVLQQVGVEMAGLLDFTSDSATAAKIKDDMIADIWAERDASVQAAEQQIAASKAKLTAYQEELKVKSQALNITRQEVKAAPQVDPKAQKAQERTQAKAELKQQRDDTPVNGLSAETQAMARELGLRKQISDTYRAADLGANASYQAQQLADIRAAEQVKTMEAQARYAEDMARMEERRAQDLLRVAGDRAAIDAVNAQYDQQEILAEEMKQQAMTEAQRNAQDARQRLRELERQQTIDTALGLGSQLMQVTQGQSKRAFEFSKKVAIASATVDGYRAATAAWSAGMSTGGPWAPFVAAAYTASSLLKTGAQIQALRGTSFNGGGSAGGAGGGSGAPSVGAGAPAGGGGGGPAPGKFSGQTQHVTITGGFFTGAMMGEFAKEFLQYQKDGGTVIINS